MWNFRNKNLILGIIIVIKLQLMEYNYTDKIDNYYTVYNIGFLPF